MPSRIKFGLKTLLKPRAACVCLPWQEDFVSHPYIQNSTQPGDNVKSADTSHTTSQKGLDHTQNGNGTSAKGTSLDKGNNPTDKNKKGNSAVDPSNNNNNTGNNNDPQTSLCLDNSVIAKGFENNGQQNATAGQSPSLTSSNNFINFCVGKTITNGQQVQAGSCNPMPMGDIPSNKNMPSCKFTSPNNLDTLKANTTFTVTMALINMQAGVFTNPDENYFGAPQQVNKDGQIIGHGHFVIQSLKSITANDVLDPTTFAFFKGIDTAAQNGALSLQVAGGLPAGAYKLSSINSAANHQAVAVPVAQRGSTDDAIYFTVTEDGKPATTTGTDSTDGNTNTPTTSGKAAGKGANVKGDKATGNGTNPDQQSGAPSTSPSPIPKQGKNNVNKAIDVAKDQYTPGTSPGNKRRSFRLEFRKDIY
ncbi:hypothetical protein DFH94DRAFT_705613 [Russula ochroleuca]|uniref:Uncharacterized protein n=1 Tax=Russula ochroleuca TaxID=152965 RepID=A0A9P5TEJ8_9AGAM|nr:hypothetical protein DFH94DRAFT_705613 [Russula ochroleuca]